MTPVVVRARFDRRVQSGHILFVQSGRTGEVTVSRRALLSVASPPLADEPRLLEYAETFCSIALTQTVLDRNPVGETFLVTANDVMNWLRGWRSTRPLAVDGAKRSSVQN
ncbi:MULTISPECIES: hypothetical protein [unclassified Rhizobium]|uniref:hypothetical protein n=1 Tax=unclassified Rhizobium TaxID=2613769 RepID=UPI001ADC39FD|nr:MULTISPECIES: hypothetical protein [unclassified Rhizobium]MBO9126936.1 hypothetical protein [Rhizobium sp. 16-488-2b]MBO9177384.1 hypothetical protein [Rhizobium sp. 16-488-2a]